MKVHLQCKCGDVHEYDCEVDRRTFRRTVLLDERVMCVDCAGTYSCGEEETCEWTYTHDESGQGGWLSSCGVFMCYDSHEFPSHITHCPEMAIDDDTGMFVKSGCGKPITIKDMVRHDKT